MGIPFNVTDAPPDTSPFDGPQEVLEPPSTKSKPDTELVVAGLKQMYFSIGVMVQFVDQRDGATIATRAEDLGESWRDLLDNDPKMRRRMKQLIQGGGWATVISAHLMVALPILGNHGITMATFIKPKEKPVEDVE